MPFGVFLLQTKAAPGRLCLFLALLLLPAATACSEPEVTVRHVLDGDTVILASGRHLRLWGIDTPELGRDGAPDQYFARESRQGLRRLLAEGAVLLVAAPVARDHYGRMLGALKLADARLVNVALVRQGLAFCYPHPDDGDWLQHELLAAQRQAMQQGRGFWPHVLRHLRERGAMVGNRRSLRFFSLGCRGADRISSRNRMPFEDAAAAFARGYAPARHCDLWPDAP